MPAKRLLIALCLLIGMTQRARAEDGYDLWLRYRPLPAAMRADASRHATGIIAPRQQSPMLMAAIGELKRGLSGLLARDIGSSSGPAGRIIIGAPGTLPAGAARGMPFDRIGTEGYVLRRAVVAGRPATIITANSDHGLLYGVFALLRLVQTGHSLAHVDVVSAPRLQLRVLDHWDNLDGHIERGYAGNSLWDWWKLPAFADPRYVDYARANASIGINGAVLNNVNASAASLTPAYIAKAAALADIFRPWGIKAYLSARFTAPIELGGLKTADPLDPAVAAWWKTKADEIYRAIPDFGGFLVKANSEGQPGPQDYHRSHADGANVLAAAVRPHGGVVMYRAFVYIEQKAGEPEDRVKQAYDNFRPLDGQFADNVLVQVKNGPLDFQPREPVSPLFGAMPRTSLMMEVQITKEYLGQATHLAYLGPLFAEALQADTMTQGSGSTVAQTLEQQRLSGIAGVANTGSDRDWSGSTFNQANWYAFGRLAWDPEQTPADIATEWAAMTFTPDPRFVVPATAMMLRSRAAVVDYMTPLGLAHIMGTGHHYGPAPWVHELARAEWNPVYYHRAALDGIGMDRTATGSDAIDQYAPPIAHLLADPATTPEQKLLWFHHLPWDYRMKSGRTLWDELALRYQRGVDEVAAMRHQWRSLRPYVDDARFAKTDTFLSIQLHEAEWWRDACLEYFQTYSRRPLPAGVAAPAHPLDHYERLDFPYAPGR